MKSVFISLPMAGKTKEQILSEQKELLGKLREMFPQEDIVQKESYLDKELSPLGCLGESLKIMATADIVAFPNDYYDARGCKLEYEAAIAYGKETFIFDKRR